MSAVAASVALTIRTFACVVFRFGTDHTYDPVFVVDATMLDQVMPESLEYSSRTVDIVPVFDHVTVSVVPA
ncbi:MAG: hypothetical protein A3I06_13985 [Candidatus Lindowbacteria bacterium RIFCSPLOWO2_02_FULL_62_12]|nr:MAG: hypothetical protein A3I06_13985 [Candidatus Lindowbacteria bacterium RIFCSPLOWO2_02_FULL_62_12]